jgi:DNA-binding NtrC family response regulator
MKSVPFSKSLSILAVDDDPSIRMLLTTRFERHGHKVTSAASVAEVLPILQAGTPIDIVITDLRMPGESGFEILKHTTLPVIIITGHGDKESAIKAVELGAFGFFEKPFDLDSLEVAVVRAFEKFQLQKERDRLNEELQRLCHLQVREIESLEFRDSHVVQTTAEIKKIVERLALKENATVLITGESGSGKEVLAREIHSRTNGREELLGRTPFVAINCSAIPADLLESELFGHEKGAFSGAVSLKLGLAEAARSGTLFLDEIGDMSPTHQTKLLRLVQERVFRRVGGTQDIPFKARIVAATHRNLQERVKEGLFREDLFYRLSVIQLHCPSLRDRGDEIFEIADRICKKFSVAGIAPERLLDLKNYSWPGNVRELHNWIERAAILGLVDDAGYVEATVPGVQRGAEPLTSARPPIGIQIYKGGIKEARARALDEIDRKLIEKVLQEQKGNLSQAARILGLDRKNLGRRIAELGISSKRLNPKKLVG